MCVPWARSWPISCRLKRSANVLRMKRRTFAQGHLVLVHRMLDELVSLSTIKLTVLSI